MGRRGKVRGGSFASNERTTVPVQRSWTHNGTRGYNFRSALTVTASGSDTQHPCTRAHTHARTRAELPMSREMELEADGIGLTLMARSCAYDPRAFVAMVDG
jgi:predicted Zn-dependent protease